jgi:hypothetical protein
MCDTASETGGGMSTMTRLIAGFALAAYAAAAPAQSASTASGQAYPIKSELVKWAKIAKASGAKVD